jgi:hypothetical protein
VTTEQFESALSGTPPTNMSLLGDRYWSISQSGGSGFSYYVKLDATGLPTPGTIYMLKKETGSITPNSATATPPTYTNLTAFTTLTGVNDFTLGMECDGVTSNAGSGQDMCDLESTTLDANTPVQGTGTWEVVSGPNTGEAQFSDVNDPSATFTPSGGAGTYKLRWTVAYPPCTPASSEVTIKVIAKPAPSAIYHD